MSFHSWNFIFIQLFVQELFHFSNKKKTDNFKMSHNSHFRQKIHSLHMKGHNMEKNSILPNVTSNIKYFELKAT